MIAVTPASGVEHIVQVLTKTEAALDELHHYYKFGRHADAFPEKPYFLFSHCGHLLFSLWLIEADSQACIFDQDSRLNRIMQQLDCNALRYSEYKRRMLHADAYQEHLQNEPTWFKFWIKAVEVLDGPTVSKSRAFPQKLLEGTVQNGSLEGKPNRKKRQTLQTLVRSGEAGRLLLRSTWILEDMISAVAAHSLTMHPQKHAIARIQVLCGLLQRLRRHIVLDSAVKGPYALFVDPTWGLPSALTRFSRNRTQGDLVVAPMDEGGTINCTYTWTAGRKHKTQSWTQEVSALLQSYEDTLFKTWSYDTAQYLQDIDDSSQAEAHWVVDGLEANDLEAISQQADRLLESFAAHPAYEGFVETMAGVLRNGRPQWQPKELSWTYVKKLDRITERLKFVCREAKVLGGEDPVAQVIANLWPPRQVPNEDADTSSPVPLAPKKDRTTERASHNQTESEVQGGTGDGNHEVHDDDTLELQSSRNRHEQTAESHSFPNDANETEESTVAMDDASTAAEAGPDGELRERHDPPAATAYAPEQDVTEANEEVAAEPADTQDQPTEETEQGSLESSDELAMTEASPDVELHERNDQPAATAYAPEQDVTEANEEVAAEPADTQDLSTGQLKVSSVTEESSQSSHEHTAERPESWNRTEQSEPVAGQDSQEDGPRDATKTKTIVSDEKAQNEEARAATPLAPSEINRQAARQILLHHLSKYHGLPEEQMNRKPLLSRQLQQTLQWKPSTVQRAMEDIFGKKPFTVYKAQCSAGIICSSLCACDRNQEGTLQVEDRTPCLHTAGTR